VYQIEQTLARDLGLGLPTQFSLFNVATEARNLLNSPTNQQLINQLISSGAINQANSSSIAALLAGLAAGGQSSILNQPIATFGGGITQSGTIIPGVTGHLSLSKSSFRALDHVYLRASQSDAATFRDGTRFPILNASFAPIFNTAAVSQVLQNQSFVAPFPSFTYEDLGLSFKATPTIHGVTDVTLKLEFQMRGLGAQQLNGVPVITNREYNGIITVPEGETAVLAGMVTRQEQLSLQGIPGLAQLPGLRQATTLNDANMDDAEILVTITPHLVRDSMHNPEAGTAFVPPSSIP
jgi:general secretion pathway protein D